MGAGVGSQLLYAFDAAGNVLWDVFVGTNPNPHCSGQPAIGRDGTIYVLSIDATLHAFAAQ
jgi:hypothetical protein